MKDQNKFTCPAPQGSAALLLQYTRRTRYHNHIVIAAISYPGQPVAGGGGKRITVAHTIQPDTPRGSTRVIITI